MNLCDHSKRKPLHGIGINDSKYVTRPLINGKLHICPFYSVWSHMIGRCYSQKNHINQPTYIGCTVHPEWYSFMTFRAWMKTQDWKNKYLDKDILIPGNKVYGPDACIFISNHINTLLNSCAATRGQWPQGVYFYKRGKKFKAQMKARGKHVHLGTFNTQEAASAAYRAAKAAHITEIANEQTDERLKTALLRHASLML